MGDGPTAKNAAAVRSALLSRSLVRGLGSGFGGSTSVSRGRTAAVGVTTSASRRAAASLAGVMVFDASEQPDQKKYEHQQSDERHSDIHLDLPRASVVAFARHTRRELPPIQGTRRRVFAICERTAGWAMWPREAPSIHVCSRPVMGRPSMRTDGSPAREERRWMPRSG